jgi:hypothetical protein
MIEEYDIIENFLKTLAIGSNEKNKNPSQNEDLLL